MNNYTGRVIHLAFTALVGIGCNSAAEGEVEVMGTTQDPLVIDLDGLWGTRRSDVCFINGGGPVRSELPNMCVDATNGASG